MEASITRSSELKDSLAIFELSYRKHRTEVFRTARQFGGPAFAEDVTHDVFLRFHRWLPKLEGETDVGGWLYRTCVNECLARLRAEGSVLRKFTRLLAGESIVGPGPDELYAEREDARVAMRALKQLPPLQQVVVTLKWLEGRPQKDIAATLEVSEGYVSKLLERALISLRQQGWEVS